MNFHSRLVGALDALILGLAALVTLALLFTLMNPLASSGHIEQQTGQPSPVIVEYASQRIRL